MKTIVDDQRKQSSARDDISRLLRKSGITPTSQRIDIAQILFSHNEHVSAEELFLKVNTLQSKVSKATVYNTLSLFSNHGLVREVFADPDRVFYDPNVSPHHHFFDASTGKLTDIPAEKIEIRVLSEIPESMQLAGIDVVVRIRSVENC